MPLAVKRYLACLAIISLLMVVYSIAMTPLLKSPEQIHTVRNEPIVTTQSAGWWQENFAPDAWQNQNPMVLQTQQGTLLFKKLAETANSDTLRLSPLTLIIPISDAGHESVVGDVNASMRVYRESELAVVLAPEGAEIQFEEAPDWASGRAPPIKEGKLLGQIQIVGVNPKLRTAAGSDASLPVQWRIDTTTVRISGRHVWTNDNVTVRFGSSIAVGKDISIFLKQNLMEKRPGNSGPWGLLDSMEIRTLKYVNVSLPPGGLWKGLKLGPADLAASHENLPARLMLTCKGIFQFDFDESEAKLSDDVLIDHRFDNEQLSDTFTCHELSASFSVPGPQDVVPKDAVMVGPMKLDHVDAVAIESGGPIATVNRVKLDAPNIAASLDAKRVEIILDDPSKGQCFYIHSQNGRTSPGARQSIAPILLKYMGTTVQATELKYIADPVQSSPGRLVMDGPGEIETQEQSGFGRARARWQTRLTMLPMDNQPLHVITLDGQALIESFGQTTSGNPATTSGFLTSEHIDITFKPGSSNPQATTAESGMRIKRIDAKGVPKPNGQGELVNSEVEMGNASQNVRVKELHLNFVYPETASTKQANTLELSDAAGRPVRQWIGQPAAASPAALPNNSPSNSNASVPSTTPSAPGATAPTTASTATAPPPLGLPINLSQPARSSNAAPSTSVGLTGPTGVGSSTVGPNSVGTGPAEPETPVVVLGKALYSDIVVDKPKPWIEKLVITGPVVISPKGPPQNDAPVWRIDGAQLQLSSDAHDHFRMQIAGGPARITFGDGWLEGPIVQLDQRSGHVWIENEGVLCVPTNLMQSRSGSNSSSANNPQLLGQQNVQWLYPLKCYWQGNMLFNGLTANIVGKIQFREGVARTGPDRLLFIEGSCEALEVRMSQPINMAMPGKTTATAQSITLRDNVYILTNQTDLHKNPVSKEALVLPEVTYELATNTIRGRGQGDIYSKHQAGGGGLGMLAGQNKTPVRNQPTSGSGLQGLHLKFRDSMELQLAEKRLNFMGKVEVGMGPIQSFDEQIDINKMNVLQLDQSLLNGDLLRIYDASDVTHRPTATMADGAWEFAAQGNVNFESRNDKGELFGKAAELTYIQAKDLLIIRGDTRIPAEIRVKPTNNSQGTLGIFHLNQGSFSMKTFGPEGDLQMTSLQWVPAGIPLPSNWKTGALTQPATGSAPGTPITPTTPRPRDGLQNWMKK